MHACTRFDLGIASYHLLSPFKSRWDKQWPARHTSMPWFQLTAQILSTCAGPRTHTPGWPCQPGRLSAARCPGPGQAAPQQRGRALPPAGHAWISHSPKLKTAEPVVHCRPTWDTLRVLLDVLYVGLLAAPHPLCGTPAPHTRTPGFLVPHHSSIHSRQNTVAYACSCQQERGWLQSSSPSRLVVRWQPALEVIHAFYTASLACRAAHTLL